MEQIRSLLRYSYHQNNSDIFKKIVMVSKDTAQEQGRWFHFLACPCSLVFKKNGRSPFCLGLFSTHGQGLLAHILPNILTGTEKGTCSLVREIQSYTRNKGERQDGQGSALTNKSTVPPDPSKVQRAGPVVVIRVSHRPVITGQTHSDQAGQDQARKSVCG